MECELHEQGNKIEVTQKTAIWNIDDDLYSYSIN